jgi:beta-1,4-mannosyltransferase
VKKILVLPDAGPQNPFQYQLIHFLEQHGYQVAKASRKRFFATLTAFNRHQPDILYYDWIQSFILGKTLFITLLKCVCFYLEIQYITLIRKRPVVHTLHNLQNHAGLWVAIERIIYKWFLQKCTRIRVYAEETKAKAVSVFRLNPDKFYVIQDVPYHYYYQNNTSPAESRAYLNIASDKFVFLFIGMVKPYKGLEELIRVFKQTATSHDVLMLAGASDSPDYSKKIADLVNTDSRIVFHNYFIAEELVQYYFNAADVVVLPFKNIEHSGSVDLAMSFKKPIITLKTTFMHQLLVHQEELLFEKPKDLQDILNKVKNKNLKKIGLSNFTIMEKSNYREFFSFFR